jgi:2-oxo-4-hydroxy-4-carboxy--5-ureidoimidazoline (OHCU) decarboxylase
MTRLCSTIVALAFVIVAAPAAVRAQDTAKSPDMAGKVITKQKLADCKKQAKEQKLSFGKRRKFVRACVSG